MRIDLYNSDNELVGSVNGRLRIPTDRKVDLRRVRSRLRYAREHGHQVVVDELTPEASVNRAQVFLWAVQRFCLETGWPVVFAIGYVKATLADGTPDPDELPAYFLTADDAGQATSEYMPVREHQPNGQTTVATDVLFGLCAPQAECDPALANWS